MPNVRKCRQALKNLAQYLAHNKLSANVSHCYKKSNRNLDDIMFTKQFL